MGLIEDAKKFREEREREHAKAIAAARGRNDRPGGSDMVSKRR
jgi:hypothetical protein